MVALARLFVRLAAWLAPAASRSRWREEWLGELTQAEAMRMRPLEVLVRALGAPLDALALRKAQRAPLAQRPTVVRLPSDGEPGRRSAPMDSFRQDVKYGLRQLTRQKGSSFVALVTLALGIGASTAIFTVVDAALLRPLPYGDPHQLVRLGLEIKESDDGIPREPSPSFEDLWLWQQADDVFSHVAGWGRVMYGRIVDGDEPERLAAINITEDYLALHRVAPILGREFNLADMQIGAPPVVLLGYGYWQRRFGGDENVVGELIHFDDESATIVGVLPPEFGATTPIWRPLIPEPGWEQRRGSGRVTAYGRLLPGISIDEAAGRLSLLMEPVPGPNGLMRVDVAVRSRIALTVEQFGTTLAILVGSVAFVLLIACVNVAGLLLARGANRQAELTIRASMGAGRLRLIRQLLTESVVLSVVGGVLGVAVAWVSLDALVANIPLRLPSDAPATINGTVLIATAVLTIVTGLLFGLAPAFRFSRVHLGTALARTSHRQGAGLSRRWSQALIGSEVALAVVLVAGAGLMLRSYNRLASVDLGFDTDGMVTVEVMPVEAHPEIHRQFYGSFLQTLRTMPEIAEAGAVDHFPLGGSRSTSQILVNGEGMRVGPRDVLPGYFEALGLPLIEGRLMTDADYFGGRPNAVVNRTAARLLFPEGPATGRQFEYRNRLFTVIGVVGDLRHGGPTINPDVEVYLPFEPTEFSVNRALTIVLRPAGQVPNLATRLRRAAQSVGPRVLIERIRSGDDWFADATVTPRRRTVLLGLLGALGLVLSLVGIFGMTSYAVARRTPEIGVRMTFGAQPGQMVGAVVRDSAWPVIIGTTLGVGVALLFTKVIASFLYETEATDPATFTVVAATLLATGCLAAWLPARRAARVDPVTALRVD